MSTTESKISPKEEAVRALYLNTHISTGEQELKVREAMQFAFQLLRQFYDEDTGTYLLYNGIPRMVPSEVLLAEHAVPESIEPTRRKTKRQHEIVPEYATVWIEAQPGDRPDNPVFLLHSTYLKRIQGNDEMHQHLDRIISDANQHEQIARYFPDQSCTPDLARHDMIMQETWKITSDGTAVEMQNGILGFHTHLGPDTSALPQVTFQQPILLAVPQQPSARAINRVLLLSACATSLFA